MQTEHPTVVEFSSGETQDGFYCEAATGNAMYLSQRLELTGVIRVSDGTVRSSHSELVDEVLQVTGCNISPAR